MYTAGPITILFSQAQKSQIPTQTLSRLVTVSVSWSLRYGPVTEFSSDKTCGQVCRTANPSGSSVKIQVVGSWLLTLLEVLISQHRGHYPTS